MYRTTKPVKHLLFGLFFLSLLTHTHAQQSRYPSFLWEITGNGLTTPSYLLGSVHLKDRRLVAANDSIFIAVANTESFGMEVHPDSVYQYIFAVRYGQRSLPQHTRLTDSQKKEFIRRYQQRYGTAPDSTAWTNPFLVRSLLNPLRTKDDDIESIMDAYLYGIAKSLNKTIVGLEPIDEHMVAAADKDRFVELKNNQDSASFNAYLEYMMQYYGKGDLQGLWDRIVPYIDWDEMERRNRTMYKNIREQLRNSSICAVVGASHLPGAIGLIDLLRADGYTLRPVGTKTTGLADTYKISYQSMRWTNLRDSIHNFSVELPEGYVHRKNDLFESRLSYGDLSTETELLVSARYVGNRAGLSENEFLDEEIKNRALSNGQKLLS